MSQFKAGDSALIIGSPWPDCPNIGRQVELVGLYGPGDEFVAPDGKPGSNGTDESLWLCFSADLKAMNMRDIWIDRGGVAFARETHLMPLRGDFQPEQQKSREVSA